MKKKVPSLEISNIPSSGGIVGSVVILKVAPLELISLLITSPVSGVLTNV